MTRKWITFDLDGTLMQNPFGKWVLPEIEELVSNRLKREVRAREALMREHEERMRQNRTVDAYDWDDMVRQLLREHLIELEIDVERLVLKHAAAPKIYLLEQTVIPVLERLKRSGYSLATVTNGFYKYQYPVMEQLGLSGLFDAIITPEIMGCGKPDVRILRSLLESGQLVAHVGDRLDHDVYLANEAGAASVWIYRDLPEEMREMQPEKRSANAHFAHVCEQKLKEENPRGDTVPYSPAYIPTHILFQIAELPEMIERLEGRTSHGEGEG
jgi:HAD superfamily hydrolase (TIGR01549 family)